MSEDNFKELLARMPEIAKAVNAFSSDSVQQQAFVALLESLGVQTLPPASDEDDKKTRSRRKKAIDEVRKVKKKDISGKPGKKTSAKLVKDLNLRPKGKVSLKDFVTQKGPNSNPETFAVIIFYLQKQLELKGITHDHVYTCFKDLQRRVPNDLIQAMRLMSSRRGWIDTSDSNDIKITVPGENFVEHDLPSRKKMEKKSK